MVPFATVISRIFDPLLMLAMTFTVFTWGEATFIPAFLFMVLLPVLLFIGAFKTGFIRTWDIRDRRERPKVLWIVIAIEIVGIAVFHMTSFIPLLGVFIGFAAITHVWKISGHMTGVALVIWAILTRFGWGWWPILLIVPLVGWARVVRRDHTVLQVIAGVLYTWTTLYAYEVGQSIFR